MASLANLLCVMDMILRCCPAHLSDRFGDAEGFKTEDLFAQLEELSASALNRFPLIQRVMGFTMDPASKGRRLWDPFILFLVFYSSLVTPCK